MIEGSFPLFWYNASDKFLILSDAKMLLENKKINISGSIFFIPYLAKYLKNSLLGEIIIEVLSDWIAS